MSAKRALVVDDSKSARMFLSRMLEKYQIDVDSAESAEQAIEYLTHHRPDVIFMDHLMPGMDGFQAVRTIKNNPRTATIPILMYTSQEGELYVGQARALGAVGVLPKQIRPADVSKVLYQLHLLPDRRTDDQSTFHQVSSGSDDDLDSTAPVARPLTEVALREHLAELRRALVATLDGHSNRIKADLHAMLERGLVQLPEGGGGEPAPAGRRVLWGWVVAAIAAIVAVASLSVANRASIQRSALADRVAQLDTALATAQSAAKGAGPAAAQAASPLNSGTDASSGASTQTDASDPKPQTAASKPIVEVVPYGEDPLSGPRLDVLRQLFDRLVAQGYHGMVNIKIFPGRFCLTGDSTDGFMLPPDDTAYSRCSVASSVPDDSGPQADHVSLGFADLAASLRSASHGAADVQIESGDAKSTIVAYPPISDALTAGEWNRAAGANNRIEIRVR